MTRTFRCEECGEVFDTSDILVSHAEIHEGIDFECPLCMETFMSDGQLIAHIQTHFNSKKDAEAVVLWARQHRKEKEAAESEATLEDYQNLHSEPSKTKSKSESTNNKKASSSKKTLKRKREEVVVVELEDSDDEKSTEVAKKKKKNGRRVPEPEPEVVDIDSDEETEPAEVLTNNDELDEAVLLEALNLENPQIAEFYDNLFTSGQLQKSKFTAQERLEMLIHLKEHALNYEEKPRPFLLLENRNKDGKGRTQCFMNTIINLLFSCKSFRKEVLQEGGDPKMSILASIFCGIIDSGRFWRWTLEKKYHQGQQDIHTIFEALMKNLRDLGAQLKMLECTSFSRRYCQKCRTTTDLRRTLQEYSILKIENGLFKKSHDNYFAPKHDRMCSCGGKIFTSRNIDTEGQYHIMMLQGGSEITDLDWNTKVYMFGSNWKIRSLALRQPDEENPTLGHFVSLVRIGEKIVCVNDSRAYEWHVAIKDLDVKMIVFEKCSNF